MNEQITIFYILRADALDFKFVTKEVIVVQDITIFREQIYGLSMICLHLL